MASPEIMGASLGLAVGLLDFIVLKWMAGKMVSRAVEHDATRDELMSVTRFMNAMALISLILFPIIGYFTGPYIFDAPVAPLGG